MQIAQTQLFSQHAKQQMQALIPVHIRKHRFISISKLAADDSENELFPESSTLIFIGLSHLY